MSISSAPSRNRTSSSPSPAASTMPVDVEAALAAARSRGRGRRRATPQCAGRQSRSSLRRARRPAASFAASAQDRRRRRRAASAPCPTIISGRFASASTLPKSPLPAAKLGERVRAGAEIVVGVGQVDRVRRSSADLDVAVAPALADAGIEHRRLVARVGADDQDRVGLLDAGDGRVEEVARAAARRIELARRPGGSRYSASRAPHQSLEREHVLDAARSPAMAPIFFGRTAFTVRGDRGERLAPGRRLRACRSART